ncbi:MAG TPA: glycogen debranching N-terminal domain-containing protein [Cryptosporangiaceae bacterium]|nr:glycogen debranching N-terminal domain-containing protein [Cryptosporangiaceae bacterium]
MGEGWAYEGGPPVAAAVGTVTVIEGVTFCIGARTGDIGGCAAEGLFFRDTRFLSRLALTVNGRGLEPLATRAPAPYAATFVTRCPPRAGTADSTLLVIRRRYVGNGMLEEITIRNHGREAAAVALMANVGADFAGLFEVKEDRVRPRADIETTVQDGALHFSVHRAGESRSVTVTGTGAPAAAPGQLRWHLVVAPRAASTVAVQVVPALDGVPVPPRYQHGQAVEASQPATRLKAWAESAPTVTSPDERFTGLLTASAGELGVLRMHDPEHRDRVVMAAGAPWFMTLFGRDSLLTSWMLLPVDPAVALGTLQTLADLQGTTVEPRSEEEPGRILHEVRSGLDTELNPAGSDIYYGSIDATPLFVMLMGELRRWGADRASIDALLPHADRALEWIQRHGDRDGDGFVEYRRATDRGLVNQGWKDSFDAITFATGALAEPPIALAEVQGYVYAAYRARAELADEAGDGASAADWAARAADLKRRFNEAFWLPDRGYFAMALDAAKRPVDALASNMGHCLWTGIVDDEKAASVAAHLLGPEMFSGFGVRTLATSMGAYNPMSYHNGSVWPHDNAVIAAGLMRYGFVAEAQRIALALIDAAHLSGGRLPELYCGFDRDEFAPPIPYPTSCTPQAWAAAAPFLLLRNLLRFDPMVPAGRVRCEPALPDQLRPMRVGRLQVAGNAVTVDVTRTDWQVVGLPPGFDLVPARGQAVAP